MFLEAMMGLGTIGDLIGGQQEIAMTKKMQKRAHEFSHNEAILARDFTAQQQQKAMDYNTAQRASAYQTAVGDLKKAGLNPMLAYSQGGASNTPMAGQTASGPSGTTSSIPRLQYGQAMLNAAGTAASFENMRRQNSLLDAQEEKVRAEKFLVEADVNRTNASAGELNARKDSLLMGIEKMRAEIPKIASEETRNYSEASKADSQIHLNRVLEELGELEKNVRLGKVGLMEAQKTMIQLETDIRRTQMPRAQNEAREHSLPFLQKWAPYMNMFNSGVGAARLFK